MSTLTKHSLVRRPLPAALAVATALALAACANTTPYPQQRLAAAQMLTPEQVAERYQVDEAWWQIYQDEQLNRLVAQALANNLDLQKAAVTVEKARFSANEAGADLVPQASGSLDGSVSKNLEQGGASSRSFSSRVGLSYELDLWQKVRATADAARQGYRASAQDLAASRLSLINSVVDAYFHLAYLDEAMALTERSIGQYREIVRITESQYRHGKVAVINPDSARQSLLSAENSLLSLRQNRNETVQTLRNLLNLQPQDDLALKPTPLGQLPATDVDLAVPLSVLANRPDLQAAEYRLQQAYASQQAARRSWYPSITLGAAVSTASDRARNLFSVPIGAGTVNINLPFLSWQTLHWQNQQAKADFESARLDFEQALTIALNEVDGYYRQYALSRETLANAEQKYRYDQNSSRYYQSRYRHGASALKDWLDALNTELSSAQTVLNQRYTVLRNENLVYQSMAGRYRARTGAADAAP